MDQKEVKTYSAFLIVILLIILSYFIARSYLASILLSIVLALVFYPVYKRILKHLKWESLSATITVFIAFLVIVVPIGLFGFIVGREVVSLYQSGVLENIGTFFGKILSENTVVSKVLSELIEKGFGFVSNTASSLLFDLPNQFLQVTVMIFAMFYLLVGGPSLAANIKRLIPFKNKEVLIQQIKDNTNAVIYGFFVIAIINFIIALIGLYLLGIPHFVLWSILVAFLVFIPFLGPTLFWVPYSVFLFFQGNIGVGIGMIILGLLLSGIETFGRPYLIGKRVDLHPVAILIGVLGGLPVFGIVGVIVGPVVLSITFILVEEIMKE